MMKLSVLYEYFTYQRWEKFPTVIGYEKYYDEIFAILSKKDRNTATRKLWCWKDLQPHNPCQFNQQQTM